MTQNNPLEPTQQQLQERFEQAVHALADQLEDSGYLLDLKMKHPKTQEYMHLTTQSFYLMFTHGYFQGLDSNVENFKD